MHRRPETPRLIRSWLIALGRSRHRTEVSRHGRARAVRGGASVWMWLAVGSLGCPSSQPTGDGSAAPATASAASGLPDRDPALARKLVAEGAMLLDVRTPAEFQERHLEGAVNIPVEELDRRLAEVDAWTKQRMDHPIVVYCRSGKRSGRAKTMLVEAGHTRVTNLGGIDDWQAGS